MSIAFTTLNIVAKAICRADLPYGLALTLQFRVERESATTEAKTHVSAAKGAETCEI